MHTRSAIVSVLIALCFASSLHADPARWEPAIKKFEEADRSTAPKAGGILFVGSSSIVKWDTGRYFPNLGVVNRGFGGSELEDSVYYFERVVLPHRPRTVVLYAGDNDIANGKKAERVAEDYEKFVSLMRQHLPGSRLIYLPVKPSPSRWKLFEEQKKANDAIRRIAERDSKRLVYVDLVTPMLGAEGKPRGDLFVADQLHMNDTGYSIWTALLRPFLFAGQEQVWVLNAYGDDLQVYEVGTWKRLASLKVGPQPHGIAATADGRTVFIAVENIQGTTGELLWVNPRTFEITHRMAVGPQPNEIECTLDGRYVYVPCNDQTWWVIDSVEKKLVKQIKTGGRPHNTIISPDGHRMYLSPMDAARKVTIVDIDHGHTVLGEIPFDNPTRPLTMSADERLLFQNTDNLLGFQVADIAGRQVIKTVTHEYPADVRARPSRCHGLAMRPDQQEIWCCDVEHFLVHVHEAVSGRFKQVQTIQMPGQIYWVDFTPDSRYAFVSIRSHGKVAVLDAQTKSMITMLEAGNTPKRTQVITVAE